MKAYIHAFQGRPWNEECEAALNGFTKLGIECRLFSTNEELDERGPEDIVVGGILMMTHVLNENGITTGANGSFAPGKVCTRAEIVTFIYRYKN